ncbi:RNA-binding domain-containing protein [Pareuzebyella sediminis]|uniref:RNA-binding domain-containing protein n=1 Tax=Pareuzebyella sediminis TaxID=2607998 RepID=UPI0011EE690A|nr:RNA-binding domain-containing protein [Pareuzebyella sediminis]
MRFKYEINAKGYLRQRESYDIEFKKAFQFGDSLAKYIKTIVGMANNRGGEIIFGINDSPRKPIGLQNNKFEDCDSLIINQFLQKYFSHDIDWGMVTMEFEEMTFGRFWVNESDIKPIVCKANYSKILREGAIYYRYRGESTEIKYPELQKLLDSERQKEKEFWVKHIEKIGEVGPRHIHILDSYKGELHSTKGKILIDKEIANQLNFIKEGEFTEKEGAPTLKLIGQITGTVDTENIPSSDDLYPYRFGQLKAELELNQHQLKCVLWKLKVKGDKKYHTSIKTGKTTETHKYSQKFVDSVKAVINRYPNWLDETIEEYRDK